MTLSLVSLDQHPRHCFGQLRTNSVVMQVALHGGAPNKNIGDAFLLVWKFPKGCTLEDITRVTSVPDATTPEASGSEHHPALSNPFTQC